MLNSTGTIRQLVDADFERQLERIEEAALDLVDNGCDVVILGGSPLFTKLGHGSDIEMGRQLTEKTGVPVTAGITGEVEALKAMGLRSLVVATPHEDDLNARMKAFLETSGFEVLAIEGYGVRKNSAISDLPEHASYKIAKRLYEKAPEADGIFIPVPALAHHRGRRSPGARDRQARGHQLPGLYLVRTEVDTNTGERDGLRAFDGQPGRVNGRWCSTRTRRWTSTPTPAASTGTTPAWTAVFWRWSGAA